MSDVFVSYKVEDRRRVKPLVEALESEGYSVWWDEQIGGGAAWRQTIEAELSAARCVIVAWSKRSVGPEGTFVQDEATRAQQRRVYVPVIIDKVHLPLGFGETQALPLNGWKGNRADPRYQAVLSAVRRLVGEERRAAAIPARTLVSRRVLLGGGAAGAAAVAAGGAWFLLKPTSAEAASDSIAVLPFANLSGDPGQTYFSDGMAEELRNALSQLAGLKVVARTSSEKVRDEEATTAARKLKVANILTGSVRISGGMIRVATQLVDGATGLGRWSETFDRRVGDALQIQSEIAQQVAQALNLQLGRSERAALTLGGTENPEALDRYLRAMAVFRSGFTEAKFRQSILLLDEAIALDPKYSRAYAQKAVTLSLLTGAYAPNSSEFRRGYAEAVEIARKAIALAPKSDRGHTALATALAGQLDVRGALREFERADALGGDNADFLIPYSNLLTKLGRSERALSAADRAIALDPLNPIPLLMRGNALFADRRYQEALVPAQQALALSPDHERALALTGDLFMLLNRPKEAQEQLARMPADDVFRLTAEAILATRAGDRKTSDQRLKQLHRLHGDSATFQYAEIHAQRGETGEALAALEHALAVRDPGIGFILIDPFLDPIRDEPRFRAVVERLNLPPAV